VVPVSFHDFFSGCATIGLLFVALSVSPEYLRGENAAPALVNTMVIALFALDPGVGHAPA